MKFLQDVLNICITMPNISLFIFYYIFLLLVPLLLIKINQIELLKMFLILLVPIATVLTESGKPELFYNLYTKNHKDLTSYISYLLISFISICAILYTSVNLGYSTNNPTYGVITGIISIIFVFLVSKEFIPIIIRKGDDYMKGNIKLNYKYNWHKYLIGVCSIFVFIILEIILGESIFSLL